MMRGWTTVFRFSFRKTACGRGYIVTTVLVALLLLVGISGGMLLFETLDTDNEEITISRAVTVGEADLSAVNMLGGNAYSGVRYESAPDMDAAAAACENDDTSVILIAEDGLITAVVPENSRISLSDAENFAAFLAGAYPYALAGENGGAAELNVPARTGTVADEAESGDGEISELFEMLVPYAVVMLMYFMVLIYGQGISNDAIMEKTSKLMDLFLVSIKPAAMLLGKTLAGAAAGILQVLAWIFSAIGGCALGVALVRHVNPETDMAIVALFEGVGGISAMFSPASLITAALVIVSGFLVYCALAGMGGALASKPEDLGSTNYLFTMALVISFFACLFTGENVGVISDAAWMGYVPFTAVLVMPGRLLTGSASIAQGLASIGISAVFAVGLCVLAGKAYAMMAFYRGKPMNPLKLMRIYKK